MCPPRIPQEGRPTWRLTPVFLDQHIQHVFTRIALARILSSGRSFQRACDLPTGPPGRLGRGQLTEKRLQRRSKLGQRGIAGSIDGNAWSTEAVTRRQSRARSTARPACDTAGQAPARGRPRFRFLLFAPTSFRRGATIPRGNSALAVSIARPGAREVRSGAGNRRSSPASLRRSGLASVPRWHRTPTLCLRLSLPRREVNEDAMPRGRPPKSTTSLARNPRRGSRFSRGGATSLGDVLGIFPGKRGIAEIIGRLDFHDAGEPDPQAGCTGIG